MIRFSSLMGNSQKLDGGAMFGNAPKALWEQWIPADEHNRIDLACRALLVESGHLRILFETGIGAFMDPKYKDRYGVQESQHVLLDSLAKLDLTHEDIDAVVLSHLHFDHAGGLLSAWRADEPSHLLFPRATYYTGVMAWERAVNPHPRDKASFVSDINRQLSASGRLRLISEEDTLEFGELSVSFFHSDGHTPGMVCSDLRWPTGRMVFAADLIPGSQWVHLPITMGYDRFPEKLIDEKRSLLTNLIADDGWLFYTHDHQHAVSRVARVGEKKKFTAVDTRGELVRAEL